VNCNDARLHIGAEPHALPAEAVRHVETCASCAALLRESARFDGALGRAFALDPPSLDPRARRPGAGRVVPFRAPAATRRPVFGRAWAMAASVLAAVGVGALLWVGRPSDALANDVVAHLAEEPDSWTKTVPLPPEDIAAVLARAGVRLDPSMNDVVYVSPCGFRGHLVPHLVVQTSRGPVTVLVMRKEHVAKERSFRGGGYDGVLVPFGDGSLAILGQGNRALTDETVARVRAALLPTG
jgi:hypothetical protein